MNSDTGHVYVVAVASRGEQFVCWDLADAGVSAYAPTLRRWRWMAGRKVEVILPVMPGYVFVWSTDIRRDFASIKAVRRVVGVLGCNSNPKPVEAVKVAALLMAEVFGLFDETLTRKLKVSISQRVRIVGSMWQGRMGVVTDLLDAEGEDVMVQIDGAGAFGKVRLKSDKLERILTTAGNQSNHS